MLDDPLAVELVERIEFPFVERFGEGERLSQWQALRARCFDEEIRRFLSRHPGATLVALGEGLETQLWRVDDGRVRWVTVDLPEVIALRRELLPLHDRNRMIAASVLDHAWTIAVPSNADVLVTAQGLLMYLAPGEVRELITVCADRCRPGPRLRRGPSLAGRARTSRRVAHRERVCAAGMELGPRPGRGAAPARLAARRLARRAPPPSRTRGRPRLGAAARHPGARGAAAAALRPRRAFRLARAARYVRVNSTSSERCACARQTTVSAPP